MGAEYENASPWKRAAFRNPRTPIDVKMGGIICRSKDRDRSASPRTRRNGHGQVLANLFREGHMPERGLEILEGIAGNRLRKEIASELGITERAVEGRMGTMLENLRKRVGKLGPVPEMDCLRLVVSRPGAIETLRRAG